MPLLRRQPFYREKPHPDIRPDDEVFHCKLTNEIFRDYEEFFERIILCNSLVWSCSITGRAGLTYQEAIDCEEKALKNLATFPGYLQKTILFLATLTHRSRLVDMNDDVFVFAKDRYFIGEVVDVVLGGEKKSCKILRVIPPSTGISDVNGCIVIESDEEDESASKRKGGVILPADQYRYVVQERGKTNITITVPSKQISRKKGLYTRDKSKLFLKQYCEPINGTWRVKSDVISKKNLDKACFLDFFAGPVPGFEITESKRKSNPKKIEEDTTPSPPEPKKKKKDDKKKEKEQKQAKEAVPEQAQMTAEEKAAIKEQLRQQKLAEKMAKKEENKMKMIEEKQRQKEEKAKEREKMMEERRIQAEYLREWSRQRDDLECDDLKVLPATPPVKTRIPSECFGDSIMVIEFVNCFKTLFDLKEYFAKGFTFEVLEKALLDTDHNGTLTDILLMMITAVFSIQEAEDEEEEELSKKDSRIDTSSLTITDVSGEQLIESATMFSKIPQRNHGCLLKKLPLDSFTMSEILRLHLLSSGARGKDKNVRYRFQQRGGYTSLDDPGLDFRRQEKEVLEKLSVECIFDLTPNEKLKILKVLIHQFLTYAASRDDIEDNYDQLRQLKNDLKQLQWSEHRREREEAAAKYKRRLEEKMKEREKMEQRRQKKLKEIEERVKLQEAGLPVPPLEESKDDDEEVIMTEQEKEQIRQQEEEEEANKKAEYALSEKKLLKNIASLQHSTMTYPLGRDRMYRRYWVFQSIPGLFIEDDEEHVLEEYIKPVPQKNYTNPFEGSNISAMNLKNIPVDPKKKTNEENGSDKENESINASANTSLNVSTANTSLNISVDNTQVSVPGTATSNVNGVIKQDNDQDVVCISDEDEKMEVDDKSFLDNLAVKQILEKPRAQWTYISSQEQFDELMNSLNPRGFREGALRQTLCEQKDRILDLVGKCPLKALSVPQKELDDSRSRSESPMEPSVSRRLRKTNKGLIKGDLAQEVLEINQRELLLDLEERIFVGSLGSLKIKDRLAWRTALEHGSYDPQTDDSLFMKYDQQRKENEKMQDDDDTSSVKSDDSFESTVKDLAKALLQIRRAVDYKYLIPPLGDTDKQRQQYKEKKLEELKKKKQDDGEESDGEEEDGIKPCQKLMERWENSLLHSTSLSQIFLYMATLEKSIAWSKSALHARCRICRRKGDAEQMLLCDMCDRGHHMYCLKPRLKIVPSGDWFCPDCRPKEVKRSPLKNKRKMFTEEEEEQEEEEEEEEEEDDEEEDSDEEEDDEEEEEEEEEVEEEEEEAEVDAHDELCAVCNKLGMLICCDSCPLSFHLACAQPPLKKVPKGKWLCQMCSGEGKQGKIKMQKSFDKKKITGKSTPNSSRASSRKGSPRDSPITVKNSKKRPRSNSPMEEKPKLKKGGRSMSKLAQDMNGDYDYKQYTSSSRGNSKVQSMKLCEDIVNELAKHEDSTPFLKPVSKKLVPDYYDIIETPMDFVTIRNKINRFEYKDTESLIHDVRLIFSNCAEYNKKSTPEFKAGQTLSKLFEKRLKENHVQDETAPPPNKKGRRTL